MRVMVIDIGNSNLKIDIWRDDTLIYNHATPTSDKFSENLAVIDNAFLKREHDAVIVLSMSDSVIYETASGEPIRLQYHEPSHPWFTGELPSYVECGLSRATALNGMLNQVSMIKHLFHAERTFRKNPKRILPVSAYIAAHLAGQKDFNSWDLTHATNSGFFNGQKPSKGDSRFPLAGWHKCVDDIIEDGLIDEKILGSYDQLDQYIFIGGHDTTFANALDVPYATKPYISCGTWLTVSRETAVSRNWKDDGTRNVAAPNGSMLNQLCIPGDTHGKNRALAHIKKHFTKYYAPVRVFGSWANSFFSEIEQHSGVEVPGHDPISNDILSQIEFELMPKNYLSKTAAQFVQKHS